MGKLSTHPLVVGHDTMRIDWDTLRRGKEWLQEVRRGPGGLATIRCDELIHLLDAIQDAAAKAIGADAVFGPRLVADAEEVMDAVRRYSPTSLVVPVVPPYDIDWDDHFAVVHLGRGSYAVVRRRRHDGALYVDRVERP